MAMTEDDAKRLAEAFGELTSVIKTNSDEERKAKEAATLLAAEEKAAADAAKAKPAFQQTAADRLAIKLAAQRGIRENLDKHLQEFEQFLSMPQSLEQPQIKQPKPAPSPVQPQNSRNEVLDLWSKLKL